MQALSYHGSRRQPSTERSQGLPRLTTRYVGRSRQNPTLYRYTRHLSGIYADTILNLAMTASQMRIAETIDAFYGDAGTRDGVSRSYKQAVEDLDAETIKALDGPYR